MAIHILITILTSSDSGILKLSLQSVLDAIKMLPETYKSTLIFTPVIIVNTLNESYYDEVCSNFKPQNISIFKSESNGRPGKGHNSEIQLFRNYKQFDWFFPLDGDDVLYDTSLWQLAEFIIKNTRSFNDTYNNKLADDLIDILFHTGLDKIRYEPQVNSTIISKGVYIKTLENINTFKEFFKYFKSPFDSLITDIGVPGRICLMSRRAANMIDPIIYWDENANMLDDYNPFLSAFTHLLNNRLHIATHCNRYIYIYNLLNENNATSTFIKDFAKDNTHLEREQIKFNKNISQFTDVKNNWNELQNIPFINLPEKPEFKKTMSYKIDFVSNTLVTYYFNKHMTELENLYKNNKWDEFITSSKLLIKRYPELLSNRQQLWLRMNLGVSFFNLKKISIARSEWNLALKSNKSKEGTDEDLKEIIKKNLLLTSEDISEAVSNW